jgi:hypothetical protein
VRECSPMTRAQAMEWLQRSARGGYAPALVVIGNMYGCAQCNMQLATDTWHAGCNMACNMHRTPRIPPACNRHVARGARNRCAGPWWAAAAAAAGPWAHAACDRTHACQRACTQCCAHRPTHRQTKLRCRSGRASVPCQSLFDFASARLVLKSGLRFRISAAVSVYAEYPVAHKQTNKQTNKQTSAKMKPH